MSFGRARRRVVPSREIDRWYMASPLCPKHIHTLVLNMDSCLRRGFSMYVCIAVYFYSFCLWSARPRKVRFMVIIIAALCHPIPWTNSLCHWLRIKRTAQNFVFLCEMFGRHLMHFACRWRKRKNTSWTGKKPQGGHQYYSCPSWWIGPTYYSQGKCGI